MNYLAHIYLSGENDPLKIGNFIADGIKGKQYEEFSGDIQKGILLHRAIDSFTDTHPIVKHSTKLLHTTHGHYSGVIMDIFYDHFLAKNWYLYHQTPLPEYANNFYELLTANKPILPERIIKLMRPMIQYNWLVMYASFEGIDEILKQMHHRTKYRGHLDIASQSLLTHYAELEQDFFKYFKELQVFVKGKTDSF